MPGRIAMASNGMSIREMMNSPGADSLILFARADYDRRVVEFWTGTLRLVTVPFESFVIPFVAGLADLDFNTISIADGGKAVEISPYRLLAKDVFKMAAKAALDEAKRKALTTGLACGNHLWDSIRYTTCRTEPAFVGFDPAKSVSENIRATVAAHQSATKPADRDSHSLDDTCLRMDARVPPHPAFNYPPVFIGYQRGMEIHKWTPNEKSGVGVQYSVSIPDTYPHQKRSWHYTIDEAVAKAEELASKGQVEQPAKPHEPKWYLLGTHGLVAIYMRIAPDGQALYRIGGERGPTRYSLDVLLDSYSDYGGPADRGPLYAAAYKYRQEWLAKHATEPSGRKTDD